MPYARYRRWCDDQKSAPRGAQSFAKEFRVISERVALRTKQDGAKIHCLDVKLVACQCLGRRADLDTKAKP
jgi:hypothetical protein